MLELLGDLCKYKTSTITSFTQIQKLTHNESYTFYVRVKTLKCLIENTRTNLRNLKFRRDLLNIYQKCRIYKRKIQDC